MHKKYNGIGGAIKFETIPVESVSGAWKTLSNCELFFEKETILIIDGMKNTILAKSNHRYSLEQLFHMAKEANTKRN